jgi:hypothetical protein
LTPPKIKNPILTDTKQSEEEESPSKELKSMIIRILNKTEEKMHKT